MFNPSSFIVEDLKTWFGSNYINLSMPEVEKVQREVVAIQVHQVDGEDERRRIHGIGLETETNSWMRDTSVEPTFFKCGLCWTGEDKLKVHQVLLRIANGKGL